MGKKSIKRNKSIYQLSREQAGLTREAASASLGCSDDTVERIESGKQNAHPSYVLKMSDVYKDPSLCNLYCAHECPIGQKYVPEVKIDNLQQIILSMVSSLNFIQKEKDRLIDIVEDGVIEDHELKDFIIIQNKLEKISMSIEALQLWVEHIIDHGKIDGAKFEQIKSEPSPPKCKHYGRSFLSHARKKPGFPVLFPSLPL